MNHDILKLAELKVPYLESTTFGDYTIKIEHDEPHDSPRDWEPLGNMLCWPRGLGDEHGYDTPNVFYHDISGLYPDSSADDLTEKQMQRCITKAKKENIILPLYVYNHGSTTISTTPFSCQYDSGRLGLIYVSRADVRKEYSVGHVSKKRHKEMIAMLKNEVNVYDQYLTGQVYGFTIEKKNDEGEMDDIDSCWSFYGYDDSYMIDCIKSAIKYDIQNTPQQSEMF